MNDITNDIDAGGRAAILLYAGDFDPSGEDIIRDIEERCPAFDEIRRVALTSEQVEEYELPPQPAKKGDPRADDFVARHGELVQVELDALPMEVLRELYADAIDEFWDEDAHQEVLDQEETDRRELAGSEGRSP